VPSLVGRSRSSADSADRLRPAGELDWHRSDPFDRLLVAQAMRLGFILVTADRSIRGYGAVAQVWAA
jgi:PIN domain nuclease of toxin-antitoxin system